MEINVLPDYDMSDIPTGCCPRFKPEGWDAQELHFRDKLFLRKTTRSVAHIPINMSAVFRKTFEKIAQNGAEDPDNFIVMSRDLSAWSAEHYFSVSRDVPGEEMVRLSGDFRTKVFEGSYRNMPNWCDAMAQISAGNGSPKLYFFYTTCPKCAKFYGKNYVVGIGLTG